MCIHIYNQFFHKYICCITMSTLVPSKGILSRLFLTLLKYIECMSFDSSEGAKNEM